VRRVGVERRAFRHKGIPSATADEDAHAPVRERLGHRELVEVARIIIVDGRPQQPRKSRMPPVAGAGPRMPATSSCAAVEKSGSSLRSIIALRAIEARHARLPWGSRFMR